MNKKYHQLARAGGIFYFELIVCLKSLHESKIGDSILIINESNLSTIYTENSVHFSQAYLNPLIIWFPIFFKVFLHFSSKKTIKVKSKYTSRKLAHKSAFSMGNILKNVIAIIRANKSKRMLFMLASSKKRCLNRLFGGPLDTSKQSMDVSILNLCNNEKDFVAN